MSTISIASFNSQPQIVPDSKLTGRKLGHGFSATAMINIVSSCNKRNELLCAVCGDSVVWAESGVLAVIGAEV